MRKMWKDFLSFARKGRMAPCQESKASLPTDGTGNSAKLASRLSNLAISQVEFADICGVTPRTVSNWVKGRTTMSEAAGLVLDLIEDHPEVRHELGIGIKFKGEPRGRPFKPGNPYRFGDRRRAVSLAGAQMERAAASGDRIPVQIPAVAPASGMPRRRQKWLKLTAG